MISNSELSGEFKNTKCIQKMMERLKNEKIENLKIFQWISWEFWAHSDCNALQMTTEAWWWMWIEFEGHSIRLWKENSDMAQQWKKRWHQNYAKRKKVRKISIQLSCQTFPWKEMTGEIWDFHKIPYFPLFPPSSSPWLSRSDTINPFSPKKNLYGFIENANNRYRSMKSM